jgi:hypothetical protein
VMPYAETSPQPEKWDSVTRRSSNMHGIVDRLALMMIDEVSCFNHQRPRLTSGSSSGSLAGQLSR